ncbi:hypothetical protein DFS34DRAFT_150642 [Phlyctochytrium arcticum]|nr:hypothetical protein DFS34DRAFT_150642 [Phlyctochytrium arcticum]
MQQVPVSLQPSKHPLITSSAKLDYSLLSNTPDLNPYLTRTTDLNRLDTTSTTLLNENFNSAAPTGVLTGNALYDSPQQMGLITSMGTNEFFSICKWNTNLSLIKVLLQREQYQYPSHKGFQFGSNIQIRSISNKVSSQISILDDNSFGSSMWCVSSGR